MSTELWGIVSVSPTDDLPQEILNAQQSGKKTVYMQAGTYPLDYTKVIEIKTDGFTLVGAGAESTILQFSSKCNSAYQCGIIVRPATGGSQIKGVRLADFNVQMVTQPGGTNNRLGGIYLKDCLGAKVERVNTDDWNWSSPAGYGFRAHNSGAVTDVLAGEITFYRCCGENTFYGIWLTGSSTYPMNRCSIIAPSFNALTSGAQPQWVPNSYGIHIQQAKGTLILGGEFANYQYL